MKSFPPHLADEPAIQQLQQELGELRDLAAEKELSLRRAQEQVNFYERDWLYTTCRNLRGTVARLRRWKRLWIDRAKIATKLVIFAGGIALSPIKAALRAFGIGKRVPIEKDPTECSLK